jgi:hypothetical protein
MDNEEQKVVITYEMTEEIIRKLPYSREELAEWERWGEENFGRWNRN